MCRDGGGGQIDAWYRRYKRWDFAADAGVMTDFQVVMIRGLYLGDLKFHLK
jgi:hypothetical protein